MKKTFLLLLSAVTVFGMVMSCNKPDDPSKPDDPKDDPQEPEETELIKIDGDFSDWSAAQGVATFDLGEEFAYPGLLTMKAVADEESFFIYFEYELQEEQGASSPFEIFVDADNDITTGGASWLWSEIGYEYMLEDESGWLDGNSVTDMASTMKIYNFDGVDGVDAWGEGGHLTQLELSDFCESAGTISNGIAKVEVAVLRSVVNANKAGKMSLGIVAYNEGWGTTGVLPQGAAAGAEPLLEINLP